MKKKTFPKKQSISQKAGLIAKTITYVAIFEGILYPILFLLFANVVFNNQRYVDIIIGPMIIGGAIACSVYVLIHVVDTMQARILYALLTFLIGFFVIGTFTLLPIGTLLFR